MPQPSPVAHLFYHGTCGVLQWGLTQAGPDMAVFHEFNVFDLTLCGANMFGTRQTFWLRGFCNSPVPSSKPLHEMLPLNMCLSVSRRWHSFCFSAAFIPWFYIAPRGPD